MIPENWDRDFESYQRRGTEQVKNSAAARAHSMTSRSQQERFERLMEKDSAYWDRLFEGTCVEWLA